MSWPASISSVSRLLENACHDLALDRVLSFYKRIPKIPSELNAGGAFSELCGAASRYLPAEGAKTAPYNKDLVSWPPFGLNGFTCC